MATGRTISANLTTDIDKKVIQFCSLISDKVKSLIPSEEDKKIFQNDFGKTHLSRDAGACRGAGKLQRDAICTRGITSKGPFSNRNLRWHPLVLANKHIPNVKTIERIEIEGEGETQTLVFVVKINNREKKFQSDTVFQLPERFETLPEHWAPHIETLKLWNDVLWTQNSCLITAFEACDWKDSIESFAVLAISIAVDNYKIDFKKVYAEIIKLLKEQQIDLTIKLPSYNFPTEINDIICCPLCKVPKSENPAKLPDRKREERFKFAFGGNKRDEGDDSSMQIMHIEPLNENGFKHNAKNVRFGHRWCNVAMTDHSINETLDFMQYIVKAHRK